MRDERRTVTKIVAELSRSKTTRIAGVSDGDVTRSGNAPKMGSGLDFCSSFSGGCNGRVCNEFCVATLQKDVSKNQLS